MALEPSPLPAQRIIQSTNDTLTTTDPTPIAYERHDGARPDPLKETRACAFLLNGHKIYDLHLAGQTNR